MVQNYSKKAWSSERIFDADLNRMENALDGRCARYVVDPTGNSGDYDTIQNAIDAAEADGGGRIFVKRGDGTVYQISSPLTVQSDDIELVSDGAVLQAQSAIDILDVDPGSGSIDNVKVVGFIFDQNYIAKCIHIARTNRCLVAKNIFDVLSYSAAQAVIFAELAGSKHTFLYNWFLAGMNAGISINGPDRCLIEGNVMDDCRGGGVYLEASTHSLIKNNQIKDASSQVTNTWDGVRLHSSTHCIVAGNIIHNTVANKPLYGIEEVAATGCDWNLLHGNVIEHWATGSVLKSGANSQDYDNLKDGP